MGKDAFIGRKMPYSLRNRTPGNPCPRTILTAIPLFHRKNTIDKSTPGKGTLGLSSRRGAKAQRKKLRVLCVFAREIKM